MTVDIDKLRQLLAEWNQPKPKGEEAKGWEWKQRVKHGELAGEAVRALPELLAEIERLRVVTDQHAKVLDEAITVNVVARSYIDARRKGWRTLEAMQLIALEAAVDAARKAGT